MNDKVLHPVEAGNAHDDYWLGGISGVARYMSKHRVSVHRYRKAGLLPPPDGRTPTGADDWKKSTIDKLYQENLEN